MGEGVGLGMGVGVLVGTSVAVGSAVAVLEGTGVWVGGRVGGDAVTVGVVNSTGVAVSSNSVRAVGSLSLSAKPPPATDPGCKK